MDPSGSYNEGKGTTGYCLFDVRQNRILKASSIKASKYVSQNDYWNEHTTLITNCFVNFKNLIVVLEDYVLYADKAKTQINSKMETCRLLGILQNHCNSLKIPCFLELASAVKQRWNDKVLCYKGYMQKRKNTYFVNDTVVDRHAKDAIRHAVHYKTFYNKGD